MSFSIFSLDRQPAELVRVQTGNQLQITNKFVIGLTWFLQITLDILHIMNELTFCIQRAPPYTHSHSPGLGLSKMKVVDAVQVHIFSVPGEGGLPHAKV